MLNIGCHLSSSKGFESMIQEAISIDANTFQFFTRNPRGSKAKDLDSKDIEKFLDIFKKEKFRPILAHAPYTLNACSSDKRIREFALMTMKDDLMRMEYVPYNFYNFHPGNHVGQGVEEGINHIVDLLNEILTEEQTTTVLLETMSGKGSEVGSKFEEIKEIIDRVHLKEKLGVCLDTCHIYDAGYDIINNLDEVVREFDAVIGLERLHFIHLNDSMNQIGSKKDRHQKIGEGFLGLDPIVNVINHPKLKDCIFILETPNDVEGYGKEIALLRSLYKK
ncbi:deoxyribonuclease IV [Selenomonadales bacterium OttesenSCG-928-I06]|nr:deoxyribonuclease IV [Selenomonadales bacterium OttesenSCG-928-I06]